jgi:hypothetical protein
VEKGPRPHDRRDTYEREVAIEAVGPPEPDGPFRRVATAILAFDVFPPELLTPVLRRVPLEVGDTVGICYHPLPGFAAFFGARVVARFDEPSGNLWRTGFTYRTLHGHVELGEETFAVEKDLTTGRIRVKLSNWSRPGLWLTWLAGPLTRWCQVHACEGLLRHLAGIAHRRDGTHRDRPRRKRILASFFSP